MASLITVYCMLVLFDMVMELHNAYTGCCNVLTYVTCNNLYAVIHTAKPLYNKRIEGLHNLVKNHAVNIFLNI